MTNFFGPFSPYLNHPLLTEERTSDEVDQLVRILGLAAGNTVLDVGCGFGRHSLAFARRGVVPTGIDPSTTMIDAARARAQDEQLKATFTVGSDEAIATSSTDSFDGAIAMFTTLGQVGPDGRDNLGVLGVTAKALGPGAGFVVEVPQRGPAVASLVTEDRFGDGDNRTEITRRFDASTARVVERFVVVAGGVTREFDLAYRLFSAEELIEHLTDAGFAGVRLAPSLQDLPSISSASEAGATGSIGSLDPDAPTMYAVATAAGAAN